MPCRGSTSSFATICRAPRAHDDHDAPSLLPEAGCFGGLVNFLLPLLFAALHLFSLLGLDLHPGWDRHELYQKLVWGGLFGFALLASTALSQRVPSWSARAALFGELRRPGLPAAPAQPHACVDPRLVCGK
jgi:hypothetical protein